MPRDIAGTHLLMVEDDSLVAALHIRLLEEYGYRVTWQASGEEALQALTALEEGPIDLVLMDIDLGPGMDGPATARAILETHNLPILFLSSHTEKEIVERTEANTTYGYVVKHSGVVVLDASIKMALRLFEARQREKEHQSIIRRAESLQRHILESISDAIFLTDSNNNILYTSPSAGHVFQVDAATVASWKNMAAVFGSEIDHLALKEGELSRDGLRLSTNVAGGEPQTFLVDIRRADLEEGEILYCCRNLTEVDTLNRQRDTALSHADLAIQTANLGTFQLNTVSNQARWNQNAERMMGRTPRDHKDVRSWFSVIDPSDRSRAFRLWKRALRGEPLREVELRLRWPGGELRHILAACSPIWTKSGQLLEIFCLAMDVTRIKRVQKRYREQARIFRAIIYNSLNGIVLADDKGRYRSANPAACDLLGYSKLDLLRMSVSDIPRPEGHESERDYSRYLQNGKDIGEFHFVHPQLGERIAQYHAVRIESDLNLSIMSDITESKSLRKSTEPPPR